MFLYRSVLQKPGNHALQDSSLSSRRLENCGRLGQVLCHGENRAGIGEEFASLWTVVL